MEKVLGRRLGAEDGPEHACKTGIPPPSRRLLFMAGGFVAPLVVNNVHDPDPDLDPKLNVHLRLNPSMCDENGPTW